MEGAEEGSPEPPGENGLPPGWTTYRVRKDQTISHVSQEVYGTARLWKPILEANGIADPRDVRAGQLLKIPPRK